MAKSREHRPSSRIATPVPRLQAKDVREITTLISRWFSAVGEQIIFGAAPARSSLNSFLERGARQNFREKLKAIQSISVALLAQSNGLSVPFHGHFHSLGQAAPMRLP
jgi:hypothetical protein